MILHKLINKYSSRSLYIDQQTNIGNKICPEQSIVGALRLLYTFAVWFLRYLISTCCVLCVVPAGHNLGCSRGRHGGARSDFVSFVLLIDGCAFVRVES
eukprot:COSAG06_NODE_3878_length_4809_cov_166.836306_3_plen_99_part_00